VDSPTLRASQPPEPAVDVTVIGLRAACVACVACVAC
jgi:hypothetical protein